MSRKRDVYKLCINLQYPAIYENMSSIGYRSYETDVLTGNLEITYNDGLTQDVIIPDNEEGAITIQKYIEPDFAISNLKNTTYVLQSGKNVTYTVVMDSPTNCSIAPWCELTSQFHYMGNNATNTFCSPAIYLSLKAQPSYITQESDSADDSIFCLMCGSGIAKKEEDGTMHVDAFNGTLAGSCGCGCTTWGHVSPTRYAWSIGPASTDGSELTPNNPAVVDTAACFGTWTAIWLRREDAPDKDVNII